MRVSEIVIPSGLNLVSLDFPRAGTDTRKEREKKLVLPTARVARLIGSSSYHEAGHAYI